MVRSLRRRNRNRSSGLPEVTLTPLIDTAFNLLIIFMVTAPMMQNSIKVDLPEGKAQESKGTTQELVVSIDKNGKYFLNGMPVAYGDLSESLRIAMGGNKDKTVFVKADQAVSYGTVIKVVDHIKVAGGVRYVALATRAKVA